MLLVGITGGIGSGKSIVCRVLSELGYPVFYSDKVAKELLFNDKSVHQQLLESIGEHVFDTSGIPDRQKLSDLIFSNDEIRKKVNSIIHPLVRSSFEKFAAESRSEFVFNEAAILFETGSYKNFDVNVLVTAPLELRIQRVLQRDKTDRESIMDRIRAQWSDEVKRDLADYILVNDEKSPLLDQIENLLADLISSAP